ncbi:unnamed protein product [Urochloa decumbens]|uniref:Protein yippee-like n=1 Tax=Urochloa decumbens TaxID=240449 RepID=A0ABC8XJY6_9POAL
MECGTGTPIVELDDAHADVYRCKHCRTHLALTDDIISKDFYCKNGKAYLFDKVVNVTVGENEDRMLITGMFTVSDIFCASCGVVLGWKYDTAFESTQKFKEGKFILDSRDQLLGPE